MNGYAFLDNRTQGNDNSNNRREPRLCCCCNRLDVLTIEISPTGALSPEKYIIFFNHHLKMDLVVELYTYTSINIIFFVGLD